MRNFKRILALLLALVLTLGVIPGGVRAAEPEDAQAVDYESADAIFEAIYALADPETKALPSETDARQVYDLVTELPGVVEGTVRMQGNAQVVWETEDGVTCGWSARMQEIMSQARPCEVEEAQEETIDYSTKASHGKDVYLAQPYYGIDENFGTDYQTEAKKLAQAMGGSYHYKATTSVTIDYLAEAVQKGGVIIFDSHGMTDFESDEDYQDSVSGAKTSYVCLQTGTGITSADYAYDSKVGTYHAVYFGYNYQAGGKMYVYGVDGTAIANHMSTKANNGLLWAANCFSMATSGLEGPLMAKGLGVSYGYSQAVTFLGDMYYAETFFAQAKKYNVGEAMKRTKEICGSWDWAPQLMVHLGYPEYYGYQTEQEARADYDAFPIVVSKEDAYPGHGKVDKVQTVKSTWKLIETTACTHNYVTVNKAAATCTTAGYSGDVVCSKCGDVKSKGSTVAALGHNHVRTGAKDPTCTKAGYTGDMVCSRCGNVKSKGTAIPALGHAFEAWYVVENPTSTSAGVREHICTRCRVKEQDAIPHAGCPSAHFRDIYATKWYHNAVDYVVYWNIMTGMSDTSFGPNSSLTRAQMAQIFYNLAGKPTVVSANRFTDVPAGKWYTDAVVWSSGVGIVNGTTATTFSPNTNLSRQDMVVMMYRAYSGGAVASQDYVSSFRDGDRVSGYAKTAMNWAIELGIINGSDGMLNPRDNMTRAQVATVLMKTFCR